MPDSSPPPSPSPATTSATDVPCTCGVGTVFYSYLHPADCPFSRAGVLPPKSREQKLADRLAEITAAAGKVRDAEYELRVARTEDGQTRLSDAVQRLVYLATEATDAR